MSIPLRQKLAVTSHVLGKRFRGIEKYALVLQLAISRSREYGADWTGGVLSEDPEALASALERIHTGAHIRPYEYAGPATAHLFIVNPFTSGWLASLLSTHPPMEKRIERLRALSARLHGGYAEQAPGSL